MSEPGRPPRRGRNSRGRPSPASLGVVRVDADFEAEYPGADRRPTEAYASLCRTGDRRSTLIEITPDGRAATDQLLPGIRALEKSILSALTPDERVHLLDLLAKILARAADVAAGAPEPLDGARIRPARPDGHPQPCRTPDDL
jgi:hypothetical protein